ncbi:MAG: hypothetical protein JW776_00660 [Candidatus Lokiarchaeota archaeon]|nr:hypothetical protein [Candidatus Lokiarchaeota archaeon]
MNRKIRKMIKYFVLIAIFAFFVSGHFLIIYGFQSRSKKTINVISTNPLTDEAIRYEKDYIINTPIDFSGTLPVVILLHGDLVDEKSLNLLTSEYVRQGYMVVRFTIDFTFYTFLEIEAVVNNLLINPIVDNSKIGIMGHSHGAHFAYWYARLRPDLIQGVITANMGTFRILHEDYYDYYNMYVNTTTYWTFRDFIYEYSNPITEDNPRNLLVLTDNYQPIRTSEFSESNLLAWNFPEMNVLYGDFNNGTAREINTEFPLFLHGSGLYNPNAIKKQIEWMNYALNVTEESVSTRPISLRIYSLFIMIGVIIVIGFILLYYVIKLIPVQFSWIKNKIYRWKKERTKNELIEIPNLLKIETKSQYPSEKLRLEKRFTRDFEYLYDTSEYFRSIILAVIGIHLLLYVLEITVSTNLLYFSLGDRFLNLFRTVFDFNDTLSDTLFRSPLSFQLMYIWIFFVFFFRRLQIKDPPIQKPKLTILDLPNIVLLVIETILSFWVFGHLMMYHWLGFNFLSSGINVLLRFAVIFYLQIVIIEFICIQASKPDSVDHYVYVKTLFFILLMYLPLSFPSVFVFLQLYKYAIYYLLPYLVVSFSVFLVVVYSKLDAISITIFNFFLLLFWKYNIYYVIFF